MKKTVFAAVLGLCAAAFALTAFAAPKYTPDGVVYARMMLADRGVSRPVSIREVRAFFLDTPLGHTARYRPFLLSDALGMFTPTAKPFASRVLYPLVSAALYPLLRFRALIAVSGLAYVVAVLLMYWLLLAFCSPQTSAVGAVLFAASPTIYSLAGAAVTDMLAIAALVAVFGAMIRYALFGHWMYLALALLCTVALALTRPLPYVPLGAAAGLMAYALASRSEKPLLQRAILIVIVAALGFAAYAIAARITHTPSLLSHLRWLYHGALTHWVYESNRPLSAAERHSFTAWYSAQLLFAVKAWIVALVTAAYPAIALVISAAGFYVARKPAVTAFLVGGLLACCLGILANPVPLELPRLIEAPATISIAGGLAMLVETILARAQRTRLRTAPGS